MMAAHGVHPDCADEALADPSAVVFDPDYNSKSGSSVRTVGYSGKARDVLTVITTTQDGVTYGVNAWPANTTDRRYYSKGG